MTGFELRTSGVGNDRYINWATTSVTRWLNYFTTTKTCSIASQFCQSKIKSTKLTLKILPKAFKILPKRRHFVKSGHTGPTTLPKLQTTFVNISHLSETCFRFFNFPARKKPTVTSSTGQGGQGGPGAIVNTSKETAHDSMMNILAEIYACLFGAFRLADKKWKSNQMS